MTLILAGRLGLMRRKTPAALAAPTISAGPTAFSAGAQATQHDIAFTMAAGNKLVLFVGMDPNTDITISSATWTAPTQSAQALTQWDQDQTGTSPITKGFMLGLDSPNLSASAGVVRINVSATVQLGAAVVGLAGALSGAPISNSTAGVATQPSCPLDPLGNVALIIDWFVNATTGGRATAGSGQTEVIDQDVGGQCAIALSTKASPAGASTTMSWTVAAAPARWVEIAAAFRGV